jgi:hypothetical protein
VKFMPGYLFQPADLPAVPRRDDPADDAFLWDQGPASGLSKVRFHDFRKAFEAFDLPNVNLFEEQVAALRSFLLKGGITDEQKKDLDLALTLGELFTLVVYGQLVLENAKLTGVEADVVDQLFDFMVRDFSALRRGAARPGGDDAGAGGGLPEDGEEACARRRPPRANLGQGNPAACGALRDEPVSRVVWPRRRIDSPENGQKQRGLERDGRTPEDLSSDLTASRSPGAGSVPVEPSVSLSGTIVDHFEVLDLLGAGASAKSIGRETLASGGWSPSRYFPRPSRRTRIGGNDSAARPWQRRHSITRTSARSTT